MKNKNKKIKVSWSNCLIHVVVWATVLLAVIVSTSCLVLYMIE